MKKMMTLWWGLLILLNIQAQPHYRWFEPSRANGICQVDTGNIFHRLPAAMETQVRPIVWRLSLNTAGEFIHFRTAARRIIVKYTVEGKMQTKPYMPMAGAGGLDLYARDNAGNWYWAPPHFKLADTSSYAYKDISLPGDPATGDFYLYLPLYNTVKWLSIGVPENSAVEFILQNDSKPIVAYGTSIMQGAGASRPGMMWTNILSRKLDKMVINLGFSGNGKYERPIFDLMATVDASLYILDCMPNLVGISEDTLFNRLVYGVNKLRTDHPGVPILLAEHAAGYMPYSMDTIRISQFHSASVVMASVFKKLKKRGMENIYLLTEKEIGFDINSTPEGLHPADIGTLKYADAYEEKIKEIQIRTRM